jgi:hypothetical protein
VGIVISEDRRSYRLYNYAAHINNVKGFSIEYIGTNMAFHRHPRSFYLHICGIFIFTHAAQFTLHLIFASPATRVF